MPRVTEALRRTWRDQRAQMLEERTHTQAGEPRSDADIAIVDFDAAVLDQLLSLPIGTKFDARDVRRKLGAASVRAYATDREETEPCQAGTPGCSIDHSADDGGCEGW